MAAKDQIRQIIAENNIALINHSISRSSWSSTRYNVHPVVVIITVCLMKHPHIVFDNLFFPNVIKINIHQKCTYNLHQANHSNYKNNLIWQFHFYQSGIEFLYLPHPHLSPAAFTVILDWMQNRFNKNHNFPIKNIK